MCINLCYVIKSKYTEYFKKQLDLFIDGMLLPNSIRLPEGAVCDVMQTLAVHI